MAAAAMPLLGSIAGTTAATGLSAGALGMAAGGSLFSMAAPTALSFGSILSGLSTILPFASAFMGNRADQSGAMLQNQSAEIQALQLESQAEFEKTRAMQEENQRRQRLSQILNTQMAMTAGRGVSIGSGSDLAIADFSIQEAEEESDIARTDSEFRQRQLRLQAGQSRLSGGASLLSSSNRQAGRTIGAVTSALERTNLSRL